MATSNPTPASSGLTPEQLQKLVEKVWALLMADLRLERARGRR